MNEKISKLLSQFEDDSYEVREQASRELAEIGPPAGKQVRVALQSTSVETRVRARELLRWFADTKSAVQLRAHQDGLECVTFPP